MTGARSWSGFTVAGLWEAPERTPLTVAAAWRKKGRLWLP
jgi:hypothetical protein